MGSMSPPTLVNDVHSRMNETRVRDVSRPSAVEEVVGAVRRSADEGLPIAVCGGRHAMGGQQFGADGLLIDITALDGVARLDTDAGLIEIGAGATWPRVINATRALQAGDPRPWTIRQKQTGADDMTLAGSLSANAHGRGLRMPPIVGDVEGFTIVAPDARVVRCSRAERPDLFALAIGGYGLFGVIVSVTLRLRRLARLRRHVEITDIENVLPRLEEITSWNAEYGDFQFALHDDESNAFLRKGVMSVYLPTDGDAPAPADHRSLTAEQWIGLLDLAHADKARAFRVYTEHYLATHGQVYDSDTHQLATYLPNYADVLAKRHSSAARRSLMITELYAPPERLLEMLAAARACLRAYKADPIYGTIRLIEADRETVLPWARERYACVIFNLSIRHDPREISAAADVFRALIDAAIDLRGSFFLTYHRWATPRQVRACYPRFDEFLAAKRRHDPGLLFQSDWYRHVASASIV